jgi:hypothetical protein
MTWQQPGPGWPTTLRPPLPHATSHAELAHPFTAWSAASAHVSNRIAHIAQGVGDRYYVRPSPHTHRLYLQLIVCYTISYAVASSEWRMALRSCGDVRIGEATNDNTSGRHGITGFCSSLSPGRLPPAFLCTISRRFHCTTGTAEPDTDTLYRLLGC